MSKEPPTLPFQVLPLCLFYHLESTNTSFTDSLTLFFHFQVTLLYYFQLCSHILFTNCSSSSQCSYAITVYSFSNYTTTSLAQIYTAFPYTFSPFSSPTLSLLVNSFLQNTLLIVVFYATSSALINMSAFADFFLTPHLISIVYFFFIS